MRLAARTGLIALLAPCAAYSSAQPADQAAPVRLNQIGLLPDGPKRAVAPDDSTVPADWRLVDGSGKEVASGKTHVFGLDPESGQRVQQADFSSFRGTGTGYRIVVDGRWSRPFSISDDTYRKLPHDALEYFYHSRAGTPIEERFVGPQLARPAGHSPERATCISGKDTNGNFWPGCPYTLDVTGGWYDAGDHGKYLVNGGIAVWTLLDSYERNRQRGDALLLADGTQRIPEAGNEVPDLLDEARWEMEFFLKMQVPEGTHLKLPVGIKRNVRGLKFTEVDASGMAHHKVADEHWTPLATRPDQDPLTRYLFPPSTGATLNLAATAAQCARLWKGIDDAFAARCLTAAKRAWTAAKRNPQAYAVDSFTGSGGYGDGDLSDEFYWAASELLVTTGDAEYRAAVIQSPYFAAPFEKEANWASVATLGNMTLAMAPAAVGEPDRARLRASLLNAADRFLADEWLTGYHVPLAGGYTWGSNAVLLNRAMILALAYDLSSRAQYRDGVIDVMDYLLGRNPLDRSFITGYGARPMRNPHHRFWAHSLNPAYPSPPPGVLSGGPNNIAMADKVAEKMKSTCKPQTCWVDDIQAFSMNEIAINWNAPLVWVSAWLASSEKVSK